MHRSPPFSRPTVSSPYQNVAAAVVIAVFLIAVALFVSFIRQPHQVTPDSSVSVEQPFVMRLSPPQSKYAHAERSQTAPAVSESVRPQPILVPSPLLPSVTVDATIANLLAAGASTSPSLIPLIVHFVIGESDDEPRHVQTPFRIQNLLAIHSAATLLTSNIYCHVVSEPVGKWWPIAKKLCAAIIPTRQMKHVFGRHIARSYNKAHIHRLEALLRYGGIAMDSDVITVASADAFANIRTAQFAAGQSQSSLVDYADGVTTAVIAAQHDSALLAEYYAAYRVFAEGTDTTTTIPTEHVWHDKTLHSLMILRPHLSTYINVAAWGKPYGDSVGMTALYDTTADVSTLSAADGLLAVHLWQNEIVGVNDEYSPTTSYTSWHNKITLGETTENDICTSKTQYGIILKQAAIRYDQKFCSK